MTSRMATYFVPGAGIDREVITTDICRYLGPDALVKPGVYKDPKRGPTAQPEPGYFVTAYRSLTTDQLTDIKADSARWIAERTRNSQINRQNGGGISPMREAEKSRQSNMTPDGYRASATRARQQDQPYSPVAPQAYGQPAQPNPAMQQYDPYGRPIPQQPQYGQPNYPQDGGNYTYGTQVAYGVNNNQPQAGRPLAPQTYPQAPAPGYPPQGRGMDTGYGGLQDNRSQGYPGSYDGGLGRSQPMAQQPNYPTSGGQSIDPYAYSRGGQQDDTAMDGYENYEDNTYIEPTPAPAPLVPAQAPRHRERERDRASEREREREREEPRRSDKHRRR